MIATLPPTYPARPISGGRLELAPPKRGDWYVEPKYNGWRVMVHPPTGTCLNRHGEELSISDEFRASLSQLRELPFPGWLDCEGLERRHGVGRGSLIVFDVIVKGLGYEDRKQFINAYLPTLRHIEECADDSVYSAPFYYYDQAKALWNQLQNQNKLVGCDFYEGLVAKRKGSEYPMQLDSPSHTTYHWMKHRFL